MAEKEQQGPTVLGEHILHHCSLAGLNQTTLAAETNLSRGVINHLIHGRQKISTTIAGKLAECFDNEAKFWLNLQRDFELGELQPPERPRAAGVAQSHKSTGVLSDKSILKWIEDEELSIEEFDQTRLQPASYDAHAHFQLGPAGRYIPIKKKLTIPGRGYARVKTLEHFLLSKNLSGHFGASSILGERGLMLSSGGHIHPGYDGFIMVTVINFTDEPAYITTEDRFLSVSFQHVDQTPERAYDGRNQGRTDATEDEERVYAGQQSKKS